LQKREDAPADFESRDDIVHFEHREQEQEWNLANDRPNGIHGLEVDKLIALEAQILGETSDVCIVCTAWLAR